MLSEFENQQRHLLDGRFYPSPTHHTSCAGKARMIKCDKRTVSTNEANLFDPRLNMMGTSTKKRMRMKKCLWCGLVACKSAGSTLIIGNYFENKKGSKQQDKRTQNLDQNVTIQGGISFNSDKVEESCLNNSWSIQNVQDTWFSHIICTLAHVFFCHSLAIPTTANDSLSSHVVQKITIRSRSWPR